MTSEEAAGAGDEDGFHDYRLQTSSRFRSLFLLRTTTPMDEVPMNKDCTFLHPYLLPFPCQTIPSSV